MSLQDNPQAHGVHSNWVVQKFGGTSVGKFALNIIEQVVQYVIRPSLPLWTCILHRTNKQLPHLDPASLTIELPLFALPEVVLQKPKAPPTGESFTSIRLDFSRLTPRVY